MCHFFVTELLCILTSLLKHFFQPFFNLYCSFQTFFSDFTAEINKNVPFWGLKNEIRKYQFSLEKVIN